MGGCLERGIDLVGGRWLESSRSLPGSERDTQA